MRAVVVSCVFPPEPVVSSRTSFDVARTLAAHGHEVNVLAPFPNRPAGALYPGFRRSLFRREASPDGFRIVRCGSVLSRRSSLSSRLAENVSFGVTSSLALLAAPRPAVVYVNTWPVFAAAMVLVVARLRRVPVVFSVQDMYPESLLSQRRRGSRWVAAAVRAIDGAVTRAAAALIVISAEFAERYRRTRRVDPSRIHVVPNWLSAEGTEEQPEAAAAVRRRHGIPAGAFLVTYAGNVGVAAGVETVVEAFRMIDDANVHLLIVGDGASVEQCQRLAGDVAPDRIHFQRVWNGLLDVQHAADALVLPTRGRQSMASMPSKLISYFFSARPVIAGALDGSETVEVIAAAGAGVVVPPDDAGAFAAAIRDISAVAPEERMRMGRAGRTWALANVTAEVCLPRVVDIVEREAR
ncbi:MAG TPA: glycosyltransferase family 4 protein [Thermoanaerobaculia bacterium]|nr:glycosyltransferase family 4 protein [Thermoanaerobaculia bacterium]